MFHSFGPRHVHTAPGQLLLWKGSQQYVDPATELVVADFTPQGSGWYLETDDRRTPWGWAMPRGLELAFECASLTAGTITVALYGRCGSSNLRLIDSHVFNAVGQYIFERWALHTPHWVLRAEKAGGGVGGLTGRVVAVYD